MSIIRIIWGTQKMFKNIKQQKERNQSFGRKPEPDLAFHQIP